MPDSALIGPYVRRFLMEDLLVDRNLSVNSQKSYRDAIALMVRFIESRYSISPDKLTIDKVTGKVIREFLMHLQKDRGNSDSTRNQRLAALRSLFHFIGRQAPEYIEAATDVHDVPMRKTCTRPVPYLEKPEMDAILDVPDRETPQGQRDYALLLFLYNTGARADEAARVTRGTLDLGASPFVEIHGKGAKTRECPIWPETVRVLSSLLAECADQRPDSPVFLNVRGQRITRFGIYSLVKRTSQKAAKAVSSLSEKRVSPHVIRHTTAMHLLRAGVDINTIRAWLGHVSLETTNKYTEADLQMKAEALKATAIPVGSGAVYRNREGRTLMSFLVGIGRSALCDVRH